MFKNIFNFLTELLVHPVIFNKFLRTSTAWETKTSRNTSINVTNSFRQNFLYITYYISGKNTKYLVGNVQEIQSAAICYICTA